MLPPSSLIGRPAVFLEYLSCLTPLIFTVFVGAALLLKLGNTHTTLLTQRFALILGLPFPPIRTLQEYALPSNN